MNNLPPRRLKPFRCSHFSQQTLKTLDLPFLPGTSQKTGVIHGVDHSSGHYLNEWQAGESLSSLFARFAACGSVQYRTQERAFFL